MDSPTPIVFSFDDAHRLVSYLIDHGILSETARETTQVQKAGEGNMNWVARVTTPQQECVVKQARPWVEKYPTIPAPINRYQSELTYYEATATQPSLAERSPSIRFVDPAQHLIVMDYIPDASDLTDVYAGRTIAKGLLDGLASYLGDLHGLALRAPLENHAMRQLNHAHIFDLPFRDDPVVDVASLGLSEAHADFATNAAAKATIAHRGEQYLGAVGPSLLHGDFYPGSWLMAGEDWYVIDPEFSFSGPPEFDWAVAYAHLVMAQDLEGAAYWASHIPHPVSQWQPWAAIEVARRLLGVAQLPLTLTTPQQITLLEACLRILSDQPTDRMLHQYLIRDSA